MLIHMLDSEDQIADWVIRGKSKEYKRTKTREHTSIQKVKDHLGGVEGQRNAWLAQAKTSSGGVVLPFFLLMRPSAFRSERTVPVVHRAALPREKNHSLALAGA